MSPTKGNTSVRISLPRNYQHPNGWTGDLETYIKEKLAATWRDGYLEQAQETAENACEGLAKLLNLLAEKGILSFDEIKAMVPMCGDIQKVE